MNSGQNPVEASFLTRPKARSGSRLILVMAATLLTLLQATVGSVPASASGDSSQQNNGKSDSDCPTYHHDDSQGDTCRQPDGTHRVRSDSSDGYVVTHGPDYADNPALGLTIDSLALRPRCVPTSVAHAHAIYAYAHDGTNNSATYTSQLQSAIETDVGFVNAESGNASVGTRRLLNFDCDATGREKVDVTQLATNCDSSNFQTVVNDLRANGFADPLTHFWVYFDCYPAAVRTAGYAGQGSLATDSRGDGANTNNTSTAYAVEYNYNGSVDAQVLLHEGSHNMGAVQNDSPNSTGAGHCVDGLDVMCYNDGGPRGPNYTASACSDRAHYDCHFNDYFNPSPAPGSYLASHWNIAASYNSFVTNPGNSVPFIGGFHFSVGMNVGGGLEAFGIDHNGHVLHNYQCGTCNGGWSGWSDALSRYGFVGNPGIATLSNGALAIFVRGFDGTISYFYQTSPGAGPWIDGQSIGNATFKSDPTALATTDGLLHVFAVDNSGNIEESHQIVSAGGFLTWTNVGGLIASDLAVGLNANGTLEAFGRDAAGYLQHAYQCSLCIGGYSPVTKVVTNAGWSGDPAVRQNLDGRLEVISAQTSKVMAHIYQQAVNTGPWINGGSFGSTTYNSNASIAANSDGRLESFGVATNAKVYHWYQSTPNGAWSAQISIGGALNSDPSAVRNQDGHLEVFARDGNGVATHSYATPSGWTGFLSLGGSF